jgi:uncharacterized membrane protein YkvA (DUF1232 family)
MGHYYEYLKERIAAYPGSVEGHIFYLPEIYRLLSNLIKATELSTGERCLILTSLGYFLTPNDIISEDIHGPSGYMDDLYIGCFSLNLIVQAHGSQLLEQYWLGESPMMEVLEYCLNKTTQDMGVLLSSEVLAFAGLVV